MPYMPISWGGFGGQLIGIYIYIYGSHVVECLGRNLDPVDRSPGSLDQTKTGGGGSGAEAS